MPWCCWKQSVMPPVKSCDFGFRYLNANGRLLFAAGGEMLHGTGIVDSRCRSSRPLALTAKFRSVVENGLQQTDELAVHDERVNAKWLRVSVSRFNDGVVLTATDLTAQKQLEIQLCQKAHHDLLTGPAEPRVAR